MTEQELQKEVIIAKDKSTKHIKTVLLFGALGLLVSVLVLIWTSWALAWKMGLTSIVVMFLSFKLIRHIETTIDRKVVEAKQSKQEKGVSKFQQRLAEMKAKRDNLKT